MKTLVLFTSKHGATANIAGKIARKLNGTAHDLKKGNAPPLDGYDCVVIGGGLFAGAIGKEAKDFAAQNESALKAKRLGLFVCGLEGKGEAEYLTANFPDALIKSAKAAKFLGGVYDPAKCGFFEKLVMRVITKQSGLVDRTDDGKVEEFVKQMLS